MNTSDPPLMLSVSGLRGIVGRTLTAAVAARYAAAFGYWLRQRADKPHVVLGRDSRPSGPQIQQAAIGGLVASGCRVTRLEIASTPGVAVMTCHLEANGGMVITASHNPAPWNGIKLLRDDGVAPPADEAQQIIDRFKADEATYPDIFEHASVHDDGATTQVHCERIIAHIDVPAIQQRGLKVVVDSVHGAGGPEAAALLEILGVELVHLDAEPTGEFNHPPEPTKQNLTGLCEAVLQHQADVGFAQDPDADRLAIVDEQGRYIGEEYTLALSCLHLLTRYEELASGESRNLAANLSTSRMINDIAAANSAHVVRSAVGEANVAEAMRHCSAMAGGEGNGGIIWPRVSYVRDSLVGIALVLEMLALRGEPVSRIVKSFPHYAIVKDKLALTPGMTDGMVETLREHFADQKLDTQDGVRIDWPDCWVHVRPSNTEPILRIIAEAASVADAQKLIDIVRHKLGVNPTA